MRDETELIEVIDADPGAFGPAPRSIRVEDGDGPPPSPDDPPRRSWSWVVGATIVVLAGVIGMVAWHPWSGTTSLVLTDPRPGESQLTERLVFDAPPSELRLATLGDSTDGTNSFDAMWNSGSIGYVLGVPDATYDLRDGTDRWFGFYALPPDHPSTRLVFGQRQIAGAPAEVSDESNGAFIDLAWGPVDGYTFAGAGSQMTIDEAVAIAEQLRIVDGRVVIVDPAGLGGLQPLGAYGDYVALTTLIQYAQNNAREQRGVVGVYYGFDGHSVVSVLGNESSLDLVRFVTNTDVQERTVHGMRAVGFTKGAGPFGGFDSSTVMWWEGGRVVLVTGDGDLSATFDLAETVRPATDDEWAEVESLG